jgi:hypothetical protein
MLGIEDFFMVARVRMAPSRSRSRRIVLSVSIRWNIMNMFLHPQGEQESTSQVGTIESGQVVIELMGGAR